MLKPMMIACAICASLTTPAHGADQSIGQAMGWQIMATQDAMTDKKSCYAMRAINKGAVMLFADKLVVGSPGRQSIAAYQFRYDDAPPSLLAEPSATDGRDYWWTGDMSRILAASRLRVRMQLVAGGVVDYDIALNAIPTLMTALKGPKCQ